MNLLVAKRVSVSAEKNLMMEEEMEFLTQLQVRAGLGFCLQVLQRFWMQDKAEVTLERLLECSRRLMMRLEDGLTGGDDGEVDGLERHGVGEEGHTFLKRPVFHR